MKSYLVDVPVLLNVFVRPHALERVFAVVKEARPSILFLIGDGPRRGVQSDRENIKKSREIVENIDWDCEVHRLYSTENQGMYATWIAANEYVFKRVDRCVFLEDDVLVSRSFFDFCAKLLEKYKDDLRINYISGMNYLGEYAEPSADYFFSKESSSWGFATWKRTFEKHTHAYRNDEYIISRTSMIANHERKDIKKKIHGYVANDVFEGHVAANEYFTRFLGLADSQMVIIPTKNMVSNIGYEEGSIHAADKLNKMTRATQKLFDMKTYEYEFPLKHPEYMVRDLYYENRVKRILAYRKPLVKLYRRIESICRVVYYGDFGRVKNKTIRIFRNKNVSYEK